MPVADGYCHHQHLVIVQTKVLVASSGRLTDYWSPSFVEPETQGIKGKDTGQPCMNAAHSTRSLNAKYAGNLPMQRQIKHQKGGKRFQRERQILLGTGLIMVSGGSSISSQ
uniref:Uncharacterized protein n=1 Tax=Oryza sativa subsp. indica TaxID=39946 RepID=A0A1V1GZW6_ORYSI|nr:hypothetical protein [Oryza sativa Indica Group]